MSIQPLLNPDSINDKSLDLYAHSLNAGTLILKTVDDNTLDLQTADLGNAGEVLHTDALGCLLGS